MSDRVRALDARQRFAASRVLFDLERRRERGRAESNAIFDRLPVDLRAGRLILAIDRAAGADPWFSSPTQIEIDIPKGLPEPLRGKLFLYLYLNIKAVAQVLEAEASP